jgi:hypothetical protein
LLGAEGADIEFLGFVVGGAVFAYIEQADAALQLRVEEDDEATATTDAEVVVEVMLLYQNRFARLLVIQLLFDFSILKHTQGMCK